MAATTILILAMMTGSCFATQKKDVVRIKNNCDESITLGKYGIRDDNRFHCDILGVQEDTVHILPGETAFVTRDGWFGSRSNDKEKRTPGYLPNHYPIYECGNRMKNEIEYDEITNKETRGAMCYENPPKYKYIEVKLGNFYAICKP